MSADEGQAGAVATTPEPADDDVHATSPGDQPPEGRGEQPSGSTGDQPPARRDDRSPAERDRAQGRDEHGEGEHPAEALGGPIGKRFSRSHPFYIGLVGGLGVLTALFLGTLLSQARTVLVLIVVALYLAMGFNPVVEWFVRHRIRRGVGVLAVFFGMLMGFGLIVLAIVPVVTQQVTALAERVPVWVAQLQENESIREFDQKYQVTQRVADYIASGDLAQQAAGGLIGFGVVVFSALFAAFTVLVLTLYFLGSLPTIMHAVYQMVPRSRRDRVASLGDEIVQKIGNYVGGQLFVAGLAGVMSFFFLNLVGLGDFALALAVAVALFDLIPLVGGAVSAVVVTSIGFLTDVRIGVFCLVYYVVYQQIENYFIMPRVMTRAVSVPGTVVIVAALLGGSLFGMVGALLAVPTAAGILLIVREVVIPRQNAA